MKIRNKIVGTMILGSALFMLASCGSTAANSNNEKHVSVMKDAQSSTPKIWYYVLNNDKSSVLNKNSSIGALYVTKNGKVTVYYAPKGGMGFKNISNKTDAQLLSSAKKWHKENYDENKKADQGDLNTQIGEAEKDLKDAKQLLKTDTAHYKEDIGLDKSVLEEDKTDIQAKQDKVNYLEKVSKNLQDKEPKFKSAFASKLSAEATTDNSGNNVQSEKLEYSVYGYRALQAIVDAEYKPVYPAYIKVKGYLPLQSTFNSPEKILDDLYTGYYGKADDTDFYFITKTTNKNAMVSFDKIKTKNVKVTDY